jgi:hypothetical protein
MSIASASGASHRIIAAATRGSQDAYAYALTNRRYLTNRIAPKIRG